MAEQMTSESGLNPRQRKALEALLTHGHVRQAANACGVSRQTLYRWMAEPAFASALRDAEALALDGLSRTLARLGDKAAVAVEAALDDGEAAHSVKIRAFDAVFGRFLQLRELVTIEQRLEAIERALDERQGR